MNDEDEKVKDDKDDNKQDEEDENDNYNSQIIKCLTFLESQAQAELNGDDDEEEEDEDKMAKEDKDDNEEDEKKNEEVDDKISPYRPGSARGFKKGGSYIEKVRMRFATFSNTVENIISQ